MTFTNATPNDATTLEKGQPKTITPLQYTMAAVILGASAGLTLYTRRTSQLMNQLNRATKNAQERKGPVKFGPKTKMEWERSRNRWEMDDI